MACAACAAVSLLFEVPSGRCGRHWKIISYGYIGYTVCLATSMWLCNGFCSLMLVYCLWVWIWHSKWVYFQWACHPGILRYRPIISAQKSKHLRNSSGQRTFSGLLGGFGDASDMIGDVPNKRPWMGILEDRWVGVIEWWWCWYAYRVRFNAGAQHFEVCFEV